MEEVMGDVEDSMKEAPSDKTPSDLSDGVKVNGEMNGAFEESMEVENAEDAFHVKNEVDDVAADGEEQTSDSNNEPKSEEGMDMDNDSSEVPSNLTVKSEVPTHSGENTEDLPQDSAKNGPSVAEDAEDLVTNTADGSDLNSEQSDNRDGVSVEQIENNVDEKEGSVDDEADGDVRSEGFSASECDDEPPEKPRTLQNGDVDGVSDREDASDSVKDNHDGKQDEEMTTPEKEDGERAEGEETPEGEDTTPTKKGKGRKNPVPLSLTPRRSSRNLNKQKSYVEDKEDLQEKDDGSDIEEIALVDPLAGAGDPLRENKENSKARNSRGSMNKTIVVNDTKHLVEIASGSKQSKGMKKEPTLVIIDTNSILTGRGPLPISQQPKLPQRSGLQITPAHMSSSSSSSTSIQQSFSVLPVTTHNQAMFSGGITSQRVSTPPTPAAPAKPPIILPSLTDDMYVVEAPSFIVPYVYEKPPIKPLKDFIENLEEAMKKQKEDEKKKKEEAEKKKEDADIRKKEEAEKEKQEAEKETEKEKEKENTEKEQDETEEMEKKDTETVTVKKESDTTEEETDDKEESKKEKKPEDGEKMEVEESTEVKKEPEEGNETDTNQDKKKESDVEKDVKDLKDVKEKDDTALREKESEKKEEKDETSSESGKVEAKSAEDLKKPLTYFDNPLGKFFMQIGVNLVQEHVQTDLLRSQKKKRDREGGKGGASTQMAISSLQQTLEFSKENNEPFHLKQKKCEYCSFKTESALVMAHHMETPHMRNYIYRCNFCPLEVRSPHDILFHMEAEHNVRGRLERGPAFHQCPNCPFEDNQKGKLTRHLVSCQKKYRPEKNQEPPLDWEPPAKIPRVSRNRPFPMGSPGVAGLTGSQKPVMGQQHPLLPKLPPGSTMVGQPTLGQVANSLGRGRGRPPIQSRFVPDLKQAQAMQQQQLQRPIAGMLYQTGRSGTQPQVLVPTSYQIAGNQIYQNTKGQANKLQQQPSISITPLPRQSSGTPPHAHSAGMAVGSNKPGHPSSGSKATFVICEICDGYIKDLEQLRNHMQWIHKVKIHPKMIYNRPPLNCQKCQFRFFTDQGLERHLLGSHGLVTSSMQEAANKGKDGGRCPVCGRVYQWKLLNHVARDHSMTLKPAHLSYKCTVCTATFGMYKQFENHVYSAHSVVAKRVMEKKPGGSGSPTVSRSPGQSQQGDSLLKPLKINDEITIIPQPARAARPAPAGRSGPVPAHLQGSKVGEDRQRRSGTSAGGTRDDDAVQIIDLDDSPSKDTLSAVQERLRRRTSLEVSQVESEDDVASPPVKKTRRD